MTTINGECLTNTQIAGRELQQKNLPNPQSLNANVAGAAKADKGLPTIDGSSTAVQAVSKGDAAKAYGSPASQHLDITV